MSTDDLQFKSYSVGGLAISCVDCRQATDNFFRLIAARSGGYVTITGAHGVVEAQRDQRLRGIINAARMTLPDGMPMQWVGRLKGVAVTRVHGHDFFKAVLGDPRASAVRHYFYGGACDVTNGIAA